MPASNAAQNGCRSGFVLYCPRVRRSMAPSAALAMMSVTAVRCWTPKITDSAAAPAAAASVNSQVGAGGACAIALMTLNAAGGASRPAPTSSMTRIAEATRSMSTVVGLAAPTTTGVVPRSPTCRCSSPRDERGAQTKTVAEPLGGRQGLVRGLTIDLQHACAAEDEIRPFLHMHDRAL